MNTHWYDAVSYFQFTINLCCTAIYDARNVNGLQGNTENINTEGLTLTCFKQQQLTSEYRITHKKDTGNIFFEFVKK